jgi:GTP pyrophosphokinase
MTRLTARFEEALMLANRIHAGQVRKATTIPYIAHPLAVAGLVLQAGGSEDQAIAALLHDVIEDHSDKISLVEITVRFGATVAAIVEGCTDAKTQPKPPWRLRKERYIAHLQDAPADERLVATADKLHNAWTTLSDYREQGEQIWERFSGRRAGTLWYYRALVDMLDRPDASPLVAEFKRVVAELERLAGVETNR